MFKNRETYATDTYVRKNVLELLQQDLIDMAMLRDKRRVLLCFITDPYQGDYELNKVTSEALGLFKAYNIPFQVLTKGGMKAARDFHLYKKSDRYAVSLTFFNEGKSLEWESNAATPKERIKSLRKAKEKGITTWASFEPVIDPEETLKLYEACKDVVNEFKIGKITAYKTGLDPDWKEFTQEIIRRCERDGKDYYIKKSLQQYV